MGSIVAKCGYGAEKHSCVSPPHPAGVCLSQSAQADLTESSRDLWIAHIDLSISLKQIGRCYRLEDMYSTCWVWIWLCFKWTSILVGRVTRFQQESQLKYMSKRPETNPNIQPLGRGALCFHSDSFLICSNRKIDCFTITVWWHNSPTYAKPILTFITVISI